MLLSFPALPHKTKNQLPALEYPKPGIENLRKKYSTMKTGLFYKPVFWQNVVFYNEKGQNSPAAVYLFLRKSQFFFNYKQRLMILQSPLYRRQRPMYDTT